MLIKGVSLVFFLSIMVLLLFIRDTKKLKATAVNYSNEKASLHQFEELLGVKAHQDKEDINFVYWTLKYEGLPYFRIVIKQDRNGKTIAASVM